MTLNSLDTTEGGNGVFQTSLKEELNTAVGWQHAQGWGWDAL